MFTKEMIVKTRLENRNNWVVQTLVDRYATEVVLIKAENDYDVTIRFILKKSQIKKFTDELNFLDGLGVRGEIVE